jgi:hypothetical protein
MDAFWDIFGIGREQHAFIAGATGSGKSELAQSLLADPGKLYSVVYDPKHSRTIGEWQGHRYIYSWQELKTSKEPRIIYRPSKEAYYKNGRLTNESEDAECQEEFFQYVFHGKRRRLYVDECSSLLGETRPNYHLKMCLTQGRELGISTVCATQRPVSIPVITMSEASKVYIFRLNWPDDQKRIEELTGRRITVEEQAELKDFEFLYYDAAQRWRWPKPIKLDLSRIPSPQSQQGVAAYG